MVGLEILVIVSACDLNYRILFTYVTEREGATASGVPSPSLAVSVKAGRGSESGRGGRKKYLPCLYMLVHC